MFNIRKSAALILTSVIAASTVLSASAASTTKSLSSNFTLVNLVDGSNNGEINYIKQDGTVWRPAESFTLAALGDQIIKRQYDDNQLAAGSGSVVVSTDGPVGAVVQILARGQQVPTSGAYIGVSEGAATANVPLVSRKGNSASGATNSQIIMQNASNQAIDIHLRIINSTNGSVAFEKVFPGIAPNASKEFDLDSDVTDAEIPPGFFGSATVSSDTAGGEVAVVSNFFTGGNAMQTFNAFTKSGTKWFLPLFTSRLPNSLSAPIAVQNVSGGDIPAHAVKLTCTKDPTSPATGNTLNTDNPSVIKNSAAVFFNPVVDTTTFPEGWYGSCKVDSGAFNTAGFVQLRFVTGDRAGAYEGILASGTAKRVIVPLIAKQLGNTFSSAVTIQNLSETTANNVTLSYKGALDGTTDTGPCTKSFPGVIPAGASLIQNHRVPDAAANSVPQIAVGCVGSLTVTGDQPLDAFVQLDFTGQSGDAFMAHDAFPVSSN
jgi:hypothetical protein